MCNPQPTSTPTPTPPVPVQAPKRGIGSLDLLVIGVVFYLLFMGGCDALKHATADLPQVAARLVATPAASVVYVTATPQSLPTAGIVRATSVPAPAPAYQVVTSVPLPAVIIVATPTPATGGVNVHVGSDGASVSVSNGPGEATPAVPTVPADTGATTSFWSPEDQTAFAATDTAWYNNVPTAEPALQAAILQSCQDPELVADSVYLQTWCKDVRP